MRSKASGGAPGNILLRGCWATLCRLSIMGAANWLCTLATSDVLGTPAPTHSSFGGVSTSGVL